MPSRTNHERFFEAIAIDVIQTLLVQDPKSSLPLSRVKNRQLVRVVEKGQWPSSTSVWCWHCCHPFQGPPIPMPTRYDDHLRAFHVIGTFCSWECMKAYSLDSHAHSSGRIDATITTFFRKVSTTTSGTRTTSLLLRAAPPRLALDVFGGNMTIEQFRECTKTMAFLPPKLIVHQPVPEEIPARLRQRPTTQQLQDAVSFEGVTMQNEMIKLKRTKPLAGRNTFVKALGVRERNPGAA